MENLYFPSSWWEDVMILQSDNHFAMIDTALERDTDRLIAMLQKLGVKKLDFILITHFHNDHFGGAPGIVRTIPTDTVWLKPYSGLCFSNGGGGQMTAAEREKEQYEYERFQSFLSQYTVVRPIDETMPALSLGKMHLRIFNKRNLVKEMFEQPQSEYRGQYLFNENTNSAMVYLECENGASAFLPGDAYEEPLSYPPAHNCITNAARQIGHKVNLYKLPHHGCGDFTSEAAARILHPDFVTVTNDEVGMQKDARFSESLRKLREVNSAVDISYPIGHHLVYHMNGKNDVHVEYLPQEPSL